MRMLDVIEVIGGGTPKRSVSDYWEGDIDWLSVKDFNYDGRYVNHAKEQITEAGLNNSSTKLLRKGDLIISARGTVGCLAQLSKPMAFNQSCYGIRGKEKIDNDFLYYLLKTKIIELQSNSHGTVFDTITIDTFKILSVNLPLLSKQKAIASVLGALDDKIENNRRMNETLQKMARAIFKSWFVNFDPVHAKALGNQPAHMDANTAALFPSTFGDNGLPDGWKITRVGEVFDLTMGQSPPGSTYNEEGAGIPFWQGRRDFGFKFPNNRVFCTAPNRLANAGDTLVSVRAPVGDVNFALEKCCIGRGVAAVIHKDRLRSYTYYTALQLREQFKVHEADGTVFGSINKFEFSNLRICKTPNCIENVFDGLITTMDQKIEINHKESLTLSELRDTLLPKLMSGEIRIADAKREVKAAV